MSENPYANYPAERARMGFEDDRETRVSVLAILSVVSAVVCCIPGLGVLAVILGVGAMLGIGRSAGRVTGMGLAALGTLLGLIVTVIWAAIGMGMGQAFHYYSNELAPAGGAIVAGAQDGDFDGARDGLTSDARADLTDEEIAAFGEALELEWGAFLGTPRSFGELVETFAATGDVWQAMGQGNRGGSTNTSFPIPLNFDGGSTVGFFTFPQSGPVAGGTPVYDDVAVILPDGRALTLRDDGPAALAVRVQGLRVVTARELLEERAAGGAEQDADTDSESGSGEGG